MATLEVNLRDSSNIVCKLCSSGKTVTPDYPSKVMQRCLSIPVTMRALIRLWRNQNACVTGNGLSNGNGGYGMQLGHGGDAMGGPGPGAGLADDAGHGPSADLNGLRHGQVKMEPSDGGAGPVDAVFSPFNSPMVMDPFGASGATHGLKKSRKRKAADFSWRSPKMKSEDCEILVESSSNDSTPQGTPTSRDAPVDFRILTPTSVEFHGLTDEGQVDPATAEKAMSAFEGEAAQDVEIEELEDVEMLKMLPRKVKKEKRSPPPPPPILLDIADGKTMVPPSVSITPINSSSPSPSLNSVLGLDRRPGIEIIPLGTPAPATLPSSITITPITSSPNKSMSDDRARKSREKDEEKARLEKKRKRKREDSPMGPPDKLPLKQDPLSKPISVSIKATDSPPMSMSSRPSSPVTPLRKYSTSPTHTSPLALMSKSASSPGGGGLSKKPSTHSPKHSPAYSSPKHMLSSNASPKHHGTSSPKHQNSSSSGKPSVTTLKSATISPSSSGKSSSGEVKSKSSSTTKESSSSRDKDRSRSSSSGSGHSSPKPKMSSVKVKQSDLSSPVASEGAGASSSSTGAGNGSGAAVSGAAAGAAGSGAAAAQSSGTSTPPPGSQDGKSPVLTAPIRNRKHSLSAVIDKLTAQHTTGEEEVRVGGCGPGESGSKGDRSAPSSKAGEVKGTSGSGKPGESTKNPGEYMVKSSSSQDGIKLTINKTRTKDPSLKSSSSKSSSPKAHSGVRPAVNSSNPAVVKKLAPSLQKFSSSSSSYSSSSKTSSSSSSTSSSSSQSKAPPSSTQKSAMPYSGMYSKSGAPKSSSGSLKMGSSLSSKQRMMKGSPSSSSSADSPRSFKIIPGKKDHSLIPELGKSLDTNFQIPKLKKTAAGPADKADAKPVASVEPAGKALDLNKSDSNSPLSKYSAPSVSPHPTSTPPPAKPPDDKPLAITLLKSGSAPLSGNCPSPKLSLPSPLSAKLDSKPGEHSPLSGVTITSIGPSSSADDNISESVSESSKGEQRPQTSISVVPSSKDDPGKLVSLKDFVDMRSSSPLDVSKSKSFDSVGSSKVEIGARDLSASAGDVGEAAGLGAGAGPDRPSQNTPQEAAELLLDFSASSSSGKTGAADPSMKKMIMSERMMGLSPCRNTPPPQPMFPTSPSVTMHIVKSPSTLINPSPRSGSPCITDDDLMDEALVGMGK